VNSGHVKLPLGDVFETSLKPLVGVEALSQARSPARDWNSSNAVTTSTVDRREKCLTAGR
jgi:hypothetical protein